MESLKNWIVTIAAALFWVSILFGSVYVVSLAAGMGLATAQKLLGVA